MKVLMVDTVDLDFNGITDCIYQYLRAMERTDIKMDVLAGAELNHALENKFHQLGIRVFHICNRKQKPMQYVLKLIKLVKQNQYDIVHVHGNSATMVFELLGAKIGGCKIRIAHSHNTTCQHVREDKILRPLFYHLVTERFACGKAAGKWLYGKNRFKIIPNGRDLDKFTFDEEVRNKVRSELGLNDSFVVGHVGGFNRQKNQAFVLKVYSELLKLRKNTKLVLIGDGELKEFIQEMADKMHLRNQVIFTGSISNVEDLLSAMDVMLLPSIHEGLPLVVLEWQAEGLSCFLSDNITRECKLSDLVHYLPLSDGAKKWAQIINQENYPERMEAQKAGKNALKVGGYDIVENAEQLKQIYRNLAASGGKG